MKLNRKIMDFFLLHLITALVYISSIMNFKLVKNKKNFFRIFNICKIIWDFYYTKKKKKKYL